MIRQIYGVLGLGIFGRTVARELAKSDQEVIVIDSNAQYINDLADEVTTAVVGDMTDLDFLRHTGIAQCQSVIIATGTNLESAVLAVMNCKKLGVPNIIVKAKNKIYEEVLYGIGAHQVISPERETGINLVSQLLRHRIKDYFQFEGDVSIIEFQIPDKWVGKTITELKLRQQYDVNIIGIRKNQNDSINTNIPLKQPLEKNLYIVAISSSKTFEEYDFLGYFD